MHAGRTREAVRLLSRAVQLHPDSVAAWAMLAKAHDSVGQWVEHNRSVGEMLRRIPSTPEDYLFKGYAETGFDSTQALDSLNKALRRRPSSNIGRLIRASIRANAAIDQSSLELAEQAVRDAETAKQDLPGNPVALWTSGMANLTAAYAYQRLGQVERVKEAQARAEHNAAALTSLRTIFPKR